MASKFLIVCAPFTRELEKRSGFSSPSLMVHSLHTIPTTTSEKTTAKSACVGLPRPDKLADHTSATTEDSAANEGALDASSGNAVGDPPKHEQALLESSKSGDNTELPEHADQDADGPSSGRHEGPSGGATEPLRWRTDCLDTCFFSANSGLIWL